MIFGTFGWPQLEATMFPLTSIKSWDWLCAILECPIFTVTHVQISTMPFIQSIFLWYLSVSSQNPSLALDLFISWCPKNCTYFYITGMGVIFGDHAVWHIFCMFLFSYVFCACVSVCTCFALFCHSCKNITTVSVCNFFVTLQSLPAAVFSDWNFRLIALLHDLVNSPHVRQLLSQFLHTCFICSCCQPVMFASSFKNALILEFPVSALYEAYVSMILVLNSLCTKMPPSISRL